MQVYKLSAIVINSTQINVLDNVSLDPEFEMAMERAAGEVSPSHVAIMSMAPSISFRTKEVAKVLGVVSPLTGLCFPTGTVVCYFAQKGKCAPTLGAGNHVSATFASGLVVVESISADQAGDAVLEGKIYAIWNESDPIVQFSDSANLPSNITVSEKFTLGPVNINGTAIDDVQSVRWDFSPQVERTSATGQAYPTMVNLETINPMIRVGFLDASRLADYALGLAQSGSATNSYLRKMANMGSRVADATAQHVKFAFAASQGMHVWGPYGGSNSQHTRGELLLYPIGGTNPIATISPAIAIT